MAQMHGTRHQAAEARHHLYQRRLAGAVGAEQGDLLAAFDHDVEVA